MKHCHTGLGSCTEHDSAYLGDPHHIPLLQNPFLLRIYLCVYTQMCEGAGACM